MRELPSGDRLDEINGRCEECRHCYKARKSDYSRGGCQHSEMEGFICMAFADEGIAEWMVGLNGRWGICEMFEKRGERRG